MCGIYGVTRNPEILDGDLSNAKRSARFLLHRGPDSQRQIEVENLCILGNTRLAIIDIASSPQPLKCNCGDHYLTFNGEIFNYKDLRQELEYEFETDGDTETLLALLCTKGTDYIHLIRGQFAFALWNSRNKELTLAVDRFGILPIYFSDDGKELKFSSRSASIETKGKATDFVTLDKFLNFRSLAAPETPYSGIQRIPSGEVWTFSETRVDRKKWTKPTRVVSTKKANSDELVRLLNQAADRIVVSDFEVGVFLSGGIDSALTAKLIQDRIPYSLKAYTAVWSTKDRFGEDISATNTAEALGLHHIQLEISAMQWWKAMVAGTEYRDGPMSEPADAVFFLLAQRASQDLKVITTGEGADELFCGYPKYRMEVLSEYRLLRRIFRYGHKALKSVLNERLDRLIFSMSQDSPSLRCSSYFSTRWPDRDNAPVSDVMNLEYIHHADALREWDIHHYLTSVLLDRADKMTMANSLECRPLFLDSDLADYALSIRARDNYSLFSTKVQLRDAARKILPLNVATEKKKGFPIPLEIWLRDELYELSKDLLQEESFRRYLSFSSIQPMKLLQEHRAGNHNYTLRLFTLISLAL